MDVDEGSALDVLRSLSMERFSGEVARGRGALRLVMLLVLLRSDKVLAVVVVAVAVLPDLVCRHEA